MKSDDALRKDVFGEGATAGLRDAMLRESVIVVRRRNRVRSVRRIASVVVILALGTMFTWRGSYIRPKATLSTAAEEKPYHLVRTQSLPAEAYITTHPLKRTETSPLPPVQIVETKPNDYQLLNDSQLLSIMAPRPCMLVQIAPGSEKLVFANTNDAQGLPVY